jgi:protein-disulfide isomerase
MNSRNRLFTTFTAIVIILLLPLGAYAQEELYKLPVGNSVALGPADAPITIFEFLDFQ